MISPSDCLESIQNGEHGSHPYTRALIESMDEDVVEDMLRVFVQAQFDDRLSDFILNAKSLAAEIQLAMEIRANNMSQASVTPLDNDTNIADYRREL